MKLTLLDLPHADDITWPVTAGDGPLRYVAGERDTLWAEDEDGRTWVKGADDRRWQPCMSFRTEP